MKRLFGVFLFVFATTFSALAGDSLDDGLQVYLPFTSNLEDASTNKVAVQVEGVVQVLAQGAYFPGGEDWLRIPHIPFNDSPFAIAMWVKVTGNNPMYGLLYQHESSENNHWLHLMFRGGLQPYLGFYNNDAISPIAIEAGKWAHLVLQYDGKHQQIWINNRLVCSRVSIPYSGKSGSTYVGRSPNWNNVPSRHFEGFMREFRIYSRALSHTEIARLNGKEGNLAALSLPDPALSNALAAQVGIPFLNISGNKIAVTGESGQIYEVRGSSDLNQPFQFLGYLTNTFGRIEFTDNEAQPGVNRFYSLKLKQ